MILSANLFLPALFVESSPDLDKNHQALLLIMLEEKAGKLCRAVSSVVNTPACLAVGRRLRLLVGPTEVRGNALAMDDY